MSIRFPSDEWTQELCRVLNNSELYAVAAKKWEGDIVLVIDDVAGVYLDLWHGECRKAEYLIDPSSAKAEFAISAGMDKWTAILNGELDPIQGLVKRQLKLDGNLVKIMKNLKAAQELIACATAIDSVIEP